MSPNQVIYTIQLFLFAGILDRNKAPPKFLIHFVCMDVKQKKNLSAVPGTPLSHTRDAQILFIFLGFIYLL